MYEDEIRKSILHDIKHKVFMKKHDTKDLDTSADRDASRMSRYKRAYEDMTAEFLSMSFIFEREISEHARKEYEKYCIKEYINSNDVTEILYEKLLNDKIVGLFNEVTTMPYTSLKYHTLLVCVLHYNYKLGRDFQNLFLHCNTEKPKDKYTIIFQYRNFWFSINNDPSGAKIGAPIPHFGNTIGRLNDIQLPEFIIDNLRRIRSWSIGLQYLEDILVFINEKEV